MNQKRVKKLRKTLRAERDENAPPAVQKGTARPLPPRLLMRRKDPTPNGLSKSYRGGAILHPMSDRALYQFAKRKGLGG